METPGVPEIRVTAANTRPVRSDGEYVLYWMIAARRARSSFALQRAVEWAVRLERPLVILEALRCDYPWASDRLHAFVIAGMADNAAAFAATPTTYYPYIEDASGGGRGLLAALAARACVVVTDEFPCFFLPRMVAAAAERLPVLVEKVDGNGLLPLRATERVFPTAFAFRRFLQDELPSHLDHPPADDAFAGAPLPRLAALPREVIERWPPADLAAPGSTPAAAAAPADRPRRGGGRRRRRRARRRPGAAALRRRAAAGVRRAPQRRRRRGHQRAVAVPPLRPRRRAPGVRRGRRARGVVARTGSAPRRAASAPAGGG